MGIANQFLNNRKSLYMLVWAKPADVLAADLRVSKQALIARCVELQVPRPLDGYWRAVAKGNPPAIPPLPPLKAHIRNSIDVQEEMTPQLPVVNEQPASGSYKPAQNAERSHPPLQLRARSFFLPAKRFC